MRRVGLSLPNGAHSTALNESNELCETGLQYKRDTAPQQMDACKLLAFYQQAGHVAEFNRNVYKNSAKALTGKGDHEAALRHWIATFLVSASYYQCSGPPEMGEVRELFEVLSQQPSGVFGDFEWQWPPLHHLFLSTPQLLSVLVDYPTIGHAGFSMACIQGPEKYGINAPQVSAHEDELGYGRLYRSQSQPDHRDVNFYCTTMMLGMLAAVPNLLRPDIPDPLLFLAGDVELDMSGRIPDQPNFGRVNAERFISMLAKHLKAELKCTALCAKSVPVSEFRNNPNPWGPEVLRFLSAQYNTDISAMLDYNINLVSIRRESDSLITSDDGSTLPRLKCLEFITSINGVKGTLVKPDTVNDSSCFTFMWLMETTVS